MEPYVYPILNCRETFLDTLRYHLLEEKKTNVIGRKYQKIFLKKSETIPNFEKTQKNEKPSMKLLSLGSDDLNVNITDFF